MAETLQCLVYISPTRMGNIGTKYRLRRVGREAPEDVDRRGGAAMGEREVPAVNSKQIMRMDGASAYCLTWLTTMAHAPQEFRNLASARKRVSRRACFGHSLRT